VRDGSRASPRLSLVLASLTLCTLSSASSLSWESGPGYRRAKVTPNGAGRTGFTLLTPGTTGIQWTNVMAPERYAERQNLMNGAGVALGDFDNDGACDIYLCNKQGPNALFRNLGQWRFTNVTESAGVACTNQWSTGAIFGDINSDGRLDLLVTSFNGPSACLLNLGEGGFTNVTQSAGLISRGGSTSMALGDIDGDGDLDLYVCYFGIEAILREGGAFSMREIGGKTIVMGRFAKRLAVVNGQLIESGEPDMLFHNDGQGRFTAVDWKDTFSDEDGKPAAAAPDFGLAVQIRDINDDGWPDIYVCNDFQTPDRLWLNDGKGHFRAAPRLALRNMSYASMGVDFGDLDRDGRLDFFTVEMLSRDHTRHARQSSPLEAAPRVIGAIENREPVARNGVYWNRGDGTYAEIAFYSGLAATDWSWTPILLDVDLDGYEDVLVSNGHLHDVNDRDVAESRPADSQRRLAESRRVLLRYPRLDTPNAAYRNRGDLTFEDAGAAWGFDSKQICHGMAVADLDNDGDLDVVLNAANDAPLIFRNDSAAPRVAVRLKGGPSNVQGIGAKVVLRGGAFPQIQQMTCGARYLSGDDPIRTFALPKAAGPFTLEVNWSSGRRSVVHGVEANWIYEIDESAASLVENQVSKVEGPSSAPDSRIAPQPTGSVDSNSAPSRYALFKDVSEAIGHIHTETPFDDFARQSLLPRRFSQLSPGAVWCDLNADRHEDLVVGSGRGGRLAVYFGDGKGELTRTNLSAFDSPLPDDTSGLVVLSGEAGKATLFVGLSRFESDTTERPSVLRYDIDRGTVVQGAPLPPEKSSPGPLAAADVDADGDLDLFVGGRLVPGRYPEPATSRLFRNDHGTFLPDRENNRALSTAGLVSAAVFSDLTGDGWPELVLACEWGPLRIFRNEAGALRPWDPAISWPDNASLSAVYPQLASVGGWWMSVTTGDFDGDGRMDIIAGNWGLNAPYHNRAPNGPWSIFYGDFAGDGRVVLLEAYLNPDLKKVVPWRDLKLLSQDWPALRQKFPTHAAYAQASLADVLGAAQTKAKELRVSTFATMLFLNRGESFEVTPLPAQTQWAPALGLSIADFDGDGREDVFVAQNYFAVRTEDNRLDAGRGLLLRGDGRGQFTAAPGHETGLTIYGEQRGAAVADFDEDGRPDLVVTQNGASTKLYRNMNARPGLRLRLSGPGGNPEGIGATVRLGLGATLGPAREFRAGSGYWSQDSAVQVLAAAVNPTSVWIRWPGGRITTSALPMGANDVSIDPAGTVVKLR